jgi:polysaccharide biosynthesis/export protein
MKDSIRLLLLAALWLFALSASAQDKPGDYQLGPGDNIRIMVFQNPDLTLETRVTESGAITYPLVGNIDLGGLTVGEAEAKLAKALKDGGFLQQPQVNIILQQVRSNQVDILGQVGKPGRYPLETTNTKLSDILAMAGGIGPAGADTVIITGMREGKPFRREIDVAGVFLDKQVQDDIPIMGGDILYVHRAPVFYIYGEVQRPGSFRIERNMIVMQAMVQAGGPSARGTERRLRLYRRNAKGELEKSTPAMTDEIRADDVLYVNEALF